MTATEAIALRPHGDFNREQIELIKRTVCVGSTDDELALFVQTAQRMRLDPFARQIFAVKRWNKNAGREVMSTQVSIDGFRLTAERTGKYAGQLGPFWSSDGKDWQEVWLEKTPPRAAKVAVLRHDFKEPVWSVATWDEYKQEGRNGLSPMWAKMGALMLAKCAESLALRRAFPNELSGVYSPEEMAQATPAVTVEVVEPEEDGGAEDRDEIRAAIGAPPKETGSPTATATTSSVACAEIPSDGDITTTARPALANTVKHDGTFATHKQVAYLHMLKIRAGITDCPGNCEKATQKYSKKAKGLVPAVVRCTYHTQLAAFKDCDDKPITTSKDLSEEQISNLIGRYERKIAGQAQRGQEDLDLAAIDREPGAEG